MFNVRLFHGGSLNHKSIIEGYNPKGSRKGNVEHGVGLYLTDSTEQAVNYSKSIKEVELLIDPSDDLYYKSAPYNEVLDFIRINCTKKFYKEFREEFDWKELSTLSLSRLEVYLVNNYRHFHKLAKVLNEFFVEHNAKFAVHTMGGYHNMRVFDFSTIISVQPVQDYYTVLPKEFIR